MKDQQLYCRDILKRVEQIKRFTIDGRDTFMASDLIQEAVIRCFEVIGEIVKRLDPSLTATHTAVPWGDFAGFRDFLIHQYDKVIMDMVWDTITDDLPGLETAVNKLLADLDKP